MARGDRILFPRASAVDADQPGGDVAGEVRDRGRGGRWGPPIKSGAIILDLYRMEVRLLPECVGRAVLGTAFGSRAVRQPEEPRSAIGPSPPRPWAASRRGDGPRGWLRPAFRP